MTLKSLLLPLHKIQRSWMGIWMDDSSLDLMMHFKETCMNNLCSPRVYSIIFTQNPRVLDRCVNEDSSLDFMNVYYDEQSNETTQLNPWVYLINFMWHPRVSWVWEFNSISFIVGPMGQRKEKKIEKTHFWASRRTPTKRWRMPSWRWCTHLGLARNATKQQSAGIEIFELKY